MTFKEDIIRMLEKKRDVYDKANDEEAYAAMMDAIREVRRMGCSTCAWCRDGYCQYYVPSEEVRGPYNICGQYEGKE